MARMTSPPRLRGRAVEINALGEALDRVASGHPATVLIEGEPGIGKSRLLTAVIEEADSRHLQVVSGRAEEPDQTRPFGLAAGVFGCVPSSADPRRAAIAGLLAAQGDGGRGPITVTSDPGLQFRAVDAFAELAGGEPGRALDVAAAVTEVADQNDVSSLTGAALRCRGLAEDDAELLHAAACAYERGPRRLELALAREDAGAAFARRGDMARGRPLLDQAIASYERLDAARDLARAEATLRSAGVRRGRRGARKRPQIGWRGLTPTERRVAGLVAEGLSNPQIGERLYVSSRTVQTHLAHVFAKLDISSRAQLAAEVTRHRGTARGAGSAPVR